jgi:hypothetical protein
MEDIGYWIDPQGAPHGIGCGSHYRYMRRSRGISDEDAEQLGWHRVRVVPGQELFNYGAVELTAAQRETLHRLMQEHRATQHRECTVPR